MVWVMLGPLGVQIAESLGLNAAQKGMMVATPVLAGALLRLVMGILVDHLKPKRAGLIGQLIVMAALAWAWLFGIHSFREILVLGVFARRCRRGLCGGAAARLALVSAAAPGHRHWASPVRATPAPCWQRCSRRGWRSRSAGATCSGWR